VIPITLYERPGDPAAEDLRRELARLAAEFPHRLVVVDLNREPEVDERLGHPVAMLRVGPYRLTWPFDPMQLRVTLAAAMAGLPAAEAAPPGESGRRAKQAVSFFTRHWLGFVNGFLFLLVGLPFAAPVLMHFGAETPARWIYAVYSPFCHQLAYRSWFLFGEQAAYPRAEARLPSLTYAQATGLDEADDAAARAYVGDNVVGYKVAICQRDAATYGSLLLGGLFFAGFRRRIRPFPLWAWLAFGVLPISLDGGTQLASRLPGWPLPLRESTPALRTLTGMLFGLASVWLAYPEADDNMKATRVQLRTQLAAHETDHG
jgi:uncharacterized membrane protein